MIVEEVQHLRSYGRKKEAVVFQTRSQFRLSEKKLREKRFKIRANSENLTWTFLLRGVGMCVKLL